MFVNGKSQSSKLEKEDASVEVHARVKRDDDGEF